MEEESVNAKSLKSGFSWPALFFGPFWMLSNKLWLEFCIFMVFMTCTGMLMKVLTTLAQQSAADIVLLFVLLMRIAIPIAVYVLIGFKGNSWISQKINSSPKLSM